jgi:hypothetical protein
MPLPIIPILIGAAAAAAGLKGVKKGIDAKQKIDEAKRINESANDIAKEAEEFIKMCRENTRLAIEQLGKTKIEILSTTMNDFVMNFSKLKNVELKESEGLSELKYFNPSSNKFKDLEYAAWEAKKLAANGLGAIGSGALVAYGTYSAIASGTVGAVASTGTAIGTLSGAAATNATLAWLGGGALSAGGLGIAGGMAVLGGLVVGPALAVGGALLDSQATKKLNEAHGNLDSAKVFKKQAKLIGTSLKGIYTRANQLNELLNQLNSFFKTYIEHMITTISGRGTDWQQFSKTEQESIYVCVQLAQTIKIVLDTSLIDQEGQLTQKSEEALAVGEKFLGQLHRGGRP